LKYYNYSQSKKEILEAMNL